MIDQVHFENFKSLQKVTIELGRITVLVGPNGAGKTTVLTGLNLLSRCAQALFLDHGTMSELGSLFTGHNDVNRLATGHSARRLTLGIRSREPREAFQLVINTKKFLEDEKTRAHRFVVDVLSPDGTTHQIPNTPGNKRPFDPSGVKPFQNSVYLHLDSAAITATSVSDEEVPLMAADGTGLASTLAWLKGAHEEALDAITRDLSTIVPGVKRIRTHREKVIGRKLKEVNIDGQRVWHPVEEAQIGDRFELVFENGTSVGSDQLSEGTVLALALLTKLQEPGRPRFIMLDDIDRGLHIEAQAKLVGVLRKLLELDPDLQILCTSHSPYLISMFGVSEIRVLALDGQRCTRVARLDEHPDFEQWKYGTQTGELWAALGSSWVAAQPAAEAPLRAEDDAQ